eukprot:TRINITY_DN58451_c0_g1_i1.p1 TRINITY_DN58451_c0_g1~~TRINITY_DN58451_c0_g1_i1.p1  ORF type:complete len:543 (-),score=60.23 TRINITY_DN58451_c0_g1_i1:64-1692(-)
MAVFVHLPLVERPHVAALAGAVQAAARVAASKVWSTQRAGIRCLCDKPFAAQVHAPKSFDENVSDASLQRREFERTLQYNKMISVCAKARDIAAGERIFFKMVKDRVIPDGFSQMLVISASGTACEVRRCESWLRRFARAGLRPEVEAYTAVVDGCARCGDLRGAENVLEEMLAVGVRPTARSYTPLLLAYRQKSAGADAEKARHVLACMRKAGVQPDIVIYTEVLACHAAVGDWEFVDICLDDMKQDRVRPSAISFSALINGCARTGDLTRAESFMARAIDEDVPLSVSMLNAILKVCGRARRADSAELWFQRMRERYGISPDLVSYNTILGVFAQAGRLADAEKELQVMSRSKLMPDVRSYTALIQGCGISGQATQAERWLSRMVEVRLVPDVVSYNAVLNACVKAGEVARMWRVHAGMKTQKVRPDAVTYTTMALPYSKRGDIERVEAFMQDSMAAGYKRGLREYSCLLSAYANAFPRPIKKVELAFRELVTSGIHPNKQILHFFRVAFGTSRARRLADELGVEARWDIDQRTDSARIG